MKTIDPNRTFKVLMGTGVVVLLFLGAAAYQTVSAGCPEGWHKIDLSCLFIPTHGDVGIHLLSYVFIGTILWSISSLLVYWHRQRYMVARLVRNMAVLRVPDNELRPLIWRLSLQNKVRLLDSEAPLCFCAGFTSPRIYISRGMVERLTPEQLEALLLHEKHHLENYAPLKTLLGKLVVSAFFFVPALHDVLKRYLIEKEIAADQIAVRQQGHCRGIAGTLEKLLGEQSIGLVEGWAVGGSEALDYRIEHLTGHVGQCMYRIPIPRLVTSFLIMVLILTSIVVPLPGSHPLSGDIASLLGSVVW